MVVADAVQSYLGLANALRKAARARAVAVARTVVAQAGLEEAAADATERASRLAEEAAEARRANRQLVETLLTTEVTKAASRFGFVRSDDLDEVREEIAELRVQLRRAQTSAASAPRKAGARTPHQAMTGAAAQASPATAAPAKKVAAKRSAARKVEAAAAEDAGTDPATDAGA